MDRSDGVPFETDPYFDWTNVTLKKCTTTIGKGKFYMFGFFDYAQN